MAGGKWEPLGACTTKYLEEQNSTIKKSQNLIYEHDGVKYKHKWFACLFLVEGILYNIGHWPLDLLLTGLPHLLILLGPLGGVVGRN